MKNKSCSIALVIVGLSFPLLFQKLFSQEPQVRIGTTQGVRARGILPIRVSFPAFGPSVFLTAQLTSVSQAASATFNYQQDKKGGRR